MESKNLLTLAITLTVGIILAGSLLMPVISDATTTERTFENEGIYYMNSFDTQADITATWDHTDPTNLIVGDETIALPQTTTFPPSLVVSETWGIRYLVEDTKTTLTIFDNTLATRFSVDSIGSKDLTVTLSNGTATLTDGTTTVTESYTEGFIIGNSGDYLMKKSTANAYVNGDSLIYSTGRSGGMVHLESSTISIHLEGTIDDGITVSSLFPTTYTTSDIVITDTAVSGYLDLYSFSNVKFNVTDTSENTDPAIYSQVIVPASVTAELSQHLAPAEIAILNALPVLIIVALVMMAAGALYLKRDD